MREGIQLVVLSGIAGALLWAQTGPLTHAERGRQLMLEQRYAEALGEWQSAIRLSPRNSDLFNFEGLAFDAVGRRDEARTAYRAAIRLQPGNVDARSNLAYSLATAGQTKEADQEFSGALLLRPRDPSLHLGRGLLRFELGDARTACHEFQESVPWPEESTTLWTIFKACLNANSMDFSVRAARLLPRDPKTQLEIGQGMTRTRHFAEALPFLESVRGPEDLRNQASLAIAEGWIASGEPAKAISTLDVLPQSREVLELRSTALENLNRRDEAQTLLNEMVKRYPDDPSAYIAGTQLLLKAKRFDEVLAILNSGLDHLPGNWLLLLRRGVTHKMRGDYESARQDLTAALNNQGDPSLVAAALGDVMAAQGDLHQAAETFRAAMDETHQPQFQLAYALALAQSGNSVAALSAAQKAVSLLPLSARAHFEYGKLLRKSGDAHTARAEFERCRELDPQFSANLYMLSRLYRELGDVPSADSAVREFLMTKHSADVPPLK